jgi:hypothetical protein
MGQLPSGVVTLSVILGMATFLLLAIIANLIDGDPPRLRSPLEFVGGDPPRPASPRLRSPLEFVGGDPPRPASPRLRSPLS